MQPVLYDHQYSYLCVVCFAYIRRHAMSIEQRRLSNKQATLCPWYVLAVPTTFYKKNLGVVIWVQGLLLHLARTIVVAVKHVHSFVFSSWFWFRNISIFWEEVKNPRRRGPVLFGPLVGPCGLGALIGSTSSNPTLDPPLILT